MEHSSQFLQELRSLIDAIPNAGWLTFFTTLFGVLVGGFVTWCIQFYFNSKEEKAQQKVQAIVV